MHRARVRACALACVLLLYKPILIARSPDAELASGGGDALLGVGGGTFANDPRVATSKNHHMVNAELMLGERGAGLNLIFLRAKKKIVAGEEIFIDYVRSALRVVQRAELPP